MLEMSQLQHKIQDELKKRSMFHHSFIKLPFNITTAEPVSEKPEPD